MNNYEKLKELNKTLLKEAKLDRSEVNPIQFPNTEDGEFNLFRSLVNIREPHEISPEFIELQDEYLKNKIKNEGIFDIETLEPVKLNDKIYLWQGDITQLNSDAIVNAANSQMLGCFIPMHNCIDNIIHTKAGIQLRSECSHIMKEQGHPEAVGTAKITDAYNLPSKYIIHTVGPQVGSKLTQKNVDDLKSSYKSILEIADENNLESVAFCCISTGVFRFPNDKAAQIAVETVENYLNDHPDSSLNRVIFNVFKDEDLEIYDNLLNN